MKLVTAAQMRSIEKAAMISGKATGLELMERAGRGAVEAIFEMWPDIARSPGNAVVLCGPGNNGGDGFVVARLLVEGGWSVEVFLLGDAGRLPPDAKTNHDRWVRLGSVASLSEMKEQPRQADLLIDALFGTGLSRPLAGAAASTMAALTKRGRPQRCVAIDAPSGLCMDSGKSLGRAFSADLTVTFHAPKPGHFLNPDESRIGELRIVDIGLGKQGGDIGLADRSLGAAERENGHKYDHGHVLVLSGGVGKGGAARLAARGALRIGAGAVTVGTPPAALIENAAQLNAIMLMRIEGAQGLTAALSDDRIGAVVMGPGLGLGDRTRALVEAAYQAEFQRGIVLDADALSSFAQESEALFAMTKDTKTVLTPHMGEFGRLFPDIHAQLIAQATLGPAFSKVDATRQAAARAGCVVLLKGADTVICDQDGGAVIVAAMREQACPWLATAGAGDVLAGFIAGLMARGFSAIQAAEEGAFLHQECARSFGPGLIAEDLPEVLPKVLRRLV